MLDSFGDVLRQILDHAEKPQHTMFVGWLRHIDDRFDLIWVWSHAILGNDVAHVGHCCHLGLILSRVEQDILPACTVHDSVMLALVSRYYDEVISNDVHDMDVGKRFFIALLHHLAR